MPSPFSPAELRLIAVILDTVFHAEPAGAEGLSSYAFSTLPDFSLAEFAAHVVASLRPPELRRFRLGLALLSSRPAALLLTGHYAAFPELPPAARQNVLAGWPASSLALKRALFSAFVRLPIAAIYANSRTAGYQTLVIEKGRWVPTEQITGSLHGFNDMLEGNGQISTSDGNLILLLGSTFGGGTTINWSASLAPPYHVRKAWADEHGLGYFASPGFAADIEAVTSRMGVSTTAIVHSKANQLFHKGAKKLGIHVDLIPQNTAGKAHDCGMCQRGCPFGEKQGAAQTWLKDCAEAGGKFMERMRVERVLFSTEPEPEQIRTDPKESSAEGRGRRYAVGVLVRDATSGRRMVVRARKAVVCASGAINTPALLLRSGLTLNGAVGKGLHVHPVTAVTGWFDAPVRPWEGSIMTLISCELENRQGTHYGCKLEVFASNPGFYAALFVPWRSSASHKAHMARYAQSFTIVVLARDKGAGRVSLDPDDGDQPLVDYAVHPFDADSLRDGILLACRTLRAAGAIEIASTLPAVPHFVADARQAPDHAARRFEKWLAQIRAAGVKPGHGVLGSAHQMSSCRMGSKPSDGSVVDGHGKVWGHEKLWVADGSVLPTATGVNPSISIMSVAHHIGSQLVKHLDGQDHARNGTGVTASKL
ncbi:hypothetical protein PtB15_5B756 [Puccinia triticina]|nr:hypothetical protein PtB15_5B756 [Puccinia triticina]